MMCAQIVGLITNATNNEASSVIIRVLGKKAINSPIIPGQNNNGKNAQRVVMVELLTVGSALHVSIDIFNDDNRIIHQHPEGENQTEQDNHIQGDVEQI